MPRVRIRRYELASADFRLKPSFVIIGAQKAGTTALAGFLAQHPLISIAKGKEADYFSFMWPKGESWYLGHFPTIWYARMRALRYVFYYMRNSGLRVTSPIAGDASPSYLEHPRAPERCYSFNPKMKIVVLLRDPISRAYSGYHHSLIKGYVKGSFEEAIERETREHLYDRAVEASGRGDEGTYWRLSRRLFLERSFYAKHIEQWLGVFPRDQVLLLGQKRLRQQPSETYQEVLRFLGVPPWSNPDFARTDVGRTRLASTVHLLARRLLRKRTTEKYPPISETTRQQLESLFSGSKQKLEELLGNQVDW